MAALILMTEGSLSPCFASGSVEDSTQAVVQTGHKGTVLSMECSSGGNPASGDRLFTSGEDGTVRVWDRADYSLEKVVRIGRYPVDMLALNAAAPEFAVLESDGMGYFAVSAWNWEEGRLLFRVPLDQAPLFLSYSDSGSYLTLGVPRWDGFIILRASDGSRVPFKPEGFGIVSFAEISRSEKTAMTYQPSGRIAYWDLATGALVKEVRTVGSLEQLRISGDKRFLLGVAKADVVLLDLVTGAVKAKLTVTGSPLVDLSESGTEAAVLVPEISSLYRWNPQSAAGAGQGAPAEASPAAGATAKSGSAPESGPIAAPAAPVTKGVPVPDGISTVRYAGEELFAAGKGGQMYSLPAQGPAGLIAQDEMADVSGVDAFGDEIAFASDRWIWVFPVSSASPSDGFSPRIFANPLKTAAGIGLLPDGQAVVWNKAGEKGAYALIDAGGNVHPGAAAFTNPLLQGVVSQNRLIALEKGGNIRIVDLAAGKQLFSIWLPGTNRIAVVGAQIVAARSVTGSEKSLVSANTGTGETVPLPGSGVFTYDLAWDARRNILYSLGVDGGGEAALFSNFGRNLEQQTRIATAQVKDLSASLALDPDSGLLYTSLGYEGVKVWDGQDMSVLDGMDAIPRRLVVGSGLLCSVNTDSSITLWSKSGERMGGLYVFSSGDWCLLLRGGKYACSDGASGEVRIEENGAVVQDPGRYRLLP